MIRNFYAWGIALASLLAVSTASTSAAVSATIDVTPVTALTGTSETTQVFARGAIKFECTHVVFEGVAPGASISTVELQPNYTTSSCKGPSNSEVHTDFTSGECSFHVEWTASKTGVTSLGCKKVGGSVTVTPTVFGASLCTIHLPAQEFEGHWVYSNIANGDLTGESTLTGISSMRTGSSLCGSEGDTAGTYIGNVTIAGEAGTDPVNLEVT